MTRQCGDCTLCCRLLPMAAETRPEFRETVAAMIAVGMLTKAEAAAAVPDFTKAAGHVCPHQRERNVLSPEPAGCAIYRRRPLGCRLWNCRWLLNDDCEDLDRPDQSHYVIDVAPDFVTDAETGKKLGVIQVWCDPKFPDAHRDPKLRAFLDRRGAEGYAALIRFGSSDAMAIFPPSITGGRWLEKPRQEARTAEHSVEERAAALGTYKINLVKQ